MSPVDPGKSLPLLAFENIVQEPLAPVEWLVEPLIAHRDRVVLYGEFGSMKSWLLLHLGLHLAAGCPWLGKFPIPQVKRVLYMDEEMNERTLRRRIKRLGMGLGLEGQSLPFQAISRVGVRFDHQEAHSLLTALGKSQFNPDVIIVESLRRVLVGSENEAEDVGAFWRNVEPILKAGKTLIVSHHMRKPSLFAPEKHRYSASGSTDILAGADTAFAVQRLAGDVLAIECVKSREAEETEPFGVSLYEEDKEGPIELRFEGAKADLEAQGGELDRAMALVGSFLKSAPSQTAERAAILASLKTHQITERTGERALTKLRKLGRVKKAGHGVWQLVTEPQTT